MRINPFRLKNISSEIPPDGHGLKKVLGPVELVMLGIGGIVGAGIFALVGTAAAGDATRPGAGPALVVSFLLTAVACGFAALCYAEFASISHVSGSAYSYAYATLGELVAWIIGWDLVLEYAVGNVAVAISWSGYFQDLIGGFGITIPQWLGTDFQTAMATPEIRDTAAAGFRRAHRDQPPGRVHRRGDHGPAGDRDQGKFLVQYRHGRDQAGRAGVLRDRGRLLFQTAELASFHAQRWAGVQAGAAVIFFAFIGFDAVSTAAEECRNPRRDLPIGILGSLGICTII